MRFLLAVAWRNLFRQSRRTLITASAMAIGVATCMAMIALIDGIYGQFNEVLVERTLGHAQAHHPEYPSKRQLHQTLSVDEDLIASLQAEPLVKGLSGRLFGQGLIGSEDRTTGGRLLGVVPEQELTVTRLAEQVPQGRFLEGEAKREAVVGEGLAEELELSLGDELMVVTQAANGSTGSDLWEVVGIFRTGSSALDRSGVYVHVDDLRELLALEGQLHELIFTTERIEDAEALSGRVESVLGSAGPGVEDADGEGAGSAGGGATDGADASDEAVLVRTWKEADPAAAQLMGMQGVSSGMMLVIILGIAAIGVLNTMLMAVLERTRELGVLQALGLSPRQIMSMILLESAMLAALACLAGGLLGGLLDWYLVTQGVDMSVNEGEGISQMGVTMDPIVYGVVEPSGVVMTVVVLFMVCIGASLWPALRAARLSPVDAMRDA